MLDENNITLDIDFDDDNEIEEHIIKEEVPKKTKDEQKAYIKEIIFKGLGICQENYKLTTELKNRVEIFQGNGITPNMLDLLDYFIDMFDNIVPAILLGNFDEIKNNLIIEDNQEIETQLKIIRKNLIKIFRDLD